MKKKMDKESVLSKAQAFGKCFDFLQPADWVEVSMVSKDFYKSLKLDISKRILSKCTINDEIRRKIWPDFILPEYRKLIIDPEMTLENIETLEIIHLDVRRTFSADPDFHQDTLVIILINLCKMFSADFSYYQGMNYIVAFLMIIFPDDNNMAFRLSATLIKTMIMKYVNMK